MKWEFGQIKRAPMVTINDVTFSPEAIVDIIEMVTNPDPARWFRFERKDSEILIYTMHARIKREEKP